MSEELVLKVKKLVPEAVLPAKAKADDAGYDVVAISDPEYTENYIQYKTGLSVQLPLGYHIELFPRSSISKHDLLLCNSVGLVDNGYRGEIIIRFKIVLNETGSNHIPRTSPYAVVYQKGDKICQMVIKKDEDFTVEEVNELSATERGTGAFGSSGK